MSFELLTSLFLKDSFKFFITWCFLKIKVCVHVCSGHPGGASIKEPTCQCRRHKKLRFGPWFGKTPGGEHGNPVQYSCLENPMDRGAWQAAVYRIAKIWA